MKDLRDLKDLTIHDVRPIPPLLSVTEVPSCFEPSAVLSRQAVLLQEDREVDVMLP